MTRGRPPGRRVFYCATCGDPYEWLGSCYWCRRCRKRLMKIWKAAHPTYDREYYIMNRLKISQQRKARRLAKMARLHPPS
jgi:hypothetical protein